MTAGCTGGLRRDRAPKVVVTHPSAALYGSDRMALESVHGLLEDGAEVMLLTGEDGPLLPVAAALGARVRVVATPVVRKAALTPRGFPGFAGGFLSGSFRAVRLLRRLRPDVVYVSTLTTPGWVLAARACGIPVLVHVHEAESTAPVAVQRVLAAPLLAADELLVNSRFAADVLLRAVPQLAARTRVVLNGVVGPPVGPDPRSPGSVLRLLYLGRLSERKGVLVAIQAVRELRRRGVDATLDLVGDVFAGHGEMPGKLRTAIGTDLPDRVRSHGFDPDVWPHLAGCDVLLVPSVLPEPFGNTAVEGILAARPVAGSAVGGLPEALAGYRSARTVPPGDAPALAAAALELAATDPGSAVHDAAVAAARHDPARYRRDVARAVRGLVGEVRR